MLGHCLEEYGFPGGEPGVMNVAIHNSSEPDRWPLNQNSAFRTNIICCYVFFQIPVFIPDIANPYLLWIALAPMLAVFGQIGAHAVVNNKNLHTWYNPGLANVVLWQVPLTSYFIYYIISNHLTNVWTWIFGVVYLVVYMFVGINKLTYSWLERILAILSQGKKWTDSIIDGGSQKHQKHDLNKLWIRKRVTAKHRNELKNSFRFCYNSFAIR
ncbi:MAG: HXXEE domain-containing protein [Muribaculaceae bacterium]|nr:HXXEE domain-containing protein [Muribaculaceae bacterium]